MPSKDTRPKRRRPKPAVSPKAARSVSSNHWLARQSADGYVAAAREAGYRSRAAYKLIELDEKFDLLRPGLRVVDLGAAPGGWTQVAVERVGRGRASEPCVVGLDIQSIDPIPGAVLVVADIEQDDVSGVVRATLGAAPDLVLSDIAPSTTGHRLTDSLRSAGLCEAAVLCATELLASGGCFVGKLLRGSGEEDVLATLRAHFTRVRYAKPPASRAESKEIFLVASGFKPATTP